jgi:hypothetical protein
VLTLHYVGGVTERRGEAVTRELGVLSKNLLLRRAARGELEQELNAQPRPANTRLSAENLRVGNDQIFSPGSCLSVLTSFPYAVALTVVGAGDGDGPRRKDQRLEQLKWR